MRKKFTTVKATEETGERLRRLADEHGVTISALLDRFSEWGERILAGQTVSLPETAGKWVWTIASDKPIQAADARLYWTDEAGAIRVDEERPP